MIARVLVTALMLFLAFYAFSGDALGGGHVLNPSGILFLFLSGLVWFVWEPIRAALRSAADESNIPIIRLGSKIISGMRKTPIQRRTSSSDA